MKFSTETDIPDLTGRVVFITGGTDGIGKECLYQLAFHNPSKIYLAARNLVKAGEVVHELEQELSQHGSCTSIIPIEMELSSLSSVREAAQEFLSQETRLDILMCNAGILMDQGLTTDGYELIFGTNHIGHSLLISLLLPSMLSTAALPGVPAGATRCIVVASSGERMASKHAYHFSELRTDLSRLSFWARYGQSKLANIHTALALADKYPEHESKVRFVAVHPGFVSTNMGRGLVKWEWLRKVLRPISRAFFGLVDVDEGAHNQLWAATGPTSVGEKQQGHASNQTVISRSGAFYHPVAKDGKGSKRAGDLAMARNLWEWTEKELQPWIDQDDNFEHTVLLTKSRV